MTAVLKEQYWKNGRLNRVWMEPLGNGDIRVWHERLIPPKSIEAHARALEDLKFNKLERARKDDGLNLTATFTPNERDEMVREGIKLGDTDGIKWALKQDKYRHAKVSKT